jgi:hypothetical protein
MRTTPSVTAATDTLPTSLPILSRGKHRNPTRGACFMEYTSVLAGEAFTDSPRCVDRELAAVLRGANDTLSDGERGALVPLLGRAIGLVVERPQGRRRLFRICSSGEDDDRATAAQLHRAVCDRFTAAIALPDGATSRSGRQPRVSRLFWDLMSEPTRITASADYVTRLVERLHLLHRCYEEAMLGLGLGLREAPVTAPVAPPGDEAAEPAART